MATRTPVPPVYAWHRSGVVLRITHQEAGMVYGWHADHMGGCCTTPIPETLFWLQPSDEDPCPWDQAYRRAPVLDFAHFWTEQDYRNACAIEVVNERIMGWAV